MVETAVRREVEIDTKLAELWEAAAKIEGYLDSAKFSLAHVVGIKPVYETRNRRVVRESVAELIVLAWGLAADESQMNHKREEAKRAIERWSTLKDQLAAIREEAKPLEEIYAAERWSRFFLVQNTGGHIHKDMSCSTCFPSTRFGWLPTLSGLTEADAVEEQGPRLCSVCFPSAPVEWTVGLPMADDKCSRSGAVVENPTRRNYLPCPDCGKLVQVLRGDRLRAHKKAVA